MKRAYSTLLPLAVREALIRAAHVEPTKDNPLARVEAIERATEMAQRQYPELYRKDARCPS